MVSGGLAATLMVVFALFGAPIEGGILSAVAIVIIAAWLSLAIGGLGIAAIPNEVYGSTGLQIKAESPLKPTFNASLANGYAGYLPPPDQHKLGGYTTWRARSSCLEEEAEPKIVAKLLELLDTVAERRRDESLVPSP